MVTIVGQGLAGTLVALEAERRGQDFRIVDVGSGATASRAAAGLFNPLIGPRFTEPASPWDHIVPFYRDLEQRLGTALIHPVPILRPWKGTKKTVTAALAGCGWSAHPEPEGLWIEGGGWVDIGPLLDVARNRWSRAGRLEERSYGEREPATGPVVWCGGVSDLVGDVWGAVTGVVGAWQPVRGDVLSVEIPDHHQDWIEVGSRFLLPLGGQRYRWGATHEADVADQGDRPEAVRLLEAELTEHLGGLPHRLVDRLHGVRPASRRGDPLVLKHPDQPDWTLFNGFGGRGVTGIPWALRPGSASSRWLPWP